jgi:imidazoleglycerol-phosphate dehydratase
MRKCNIERNTNETKIKVELNIDGTGQYDNATGVGFLDHMLDLFARHGRFDLKVVCDGDTHIDYHHSVEDIGIAIGKCFSDALGEMRGINRYGNFYMPMDEALTLVAIDISGRPLLSFDAMMPTEKVGDFDTELVQEFFLGLTRNLKATVHIKSIDGENTHHIIESIFKGFGRALKEAVAINNEYINEIPSTKGVLV